MVHVVKRQLPHSQDVHRARRACVELVLEGDGWNEVTRGRLLASQRIGLLEVEFVLLAAIMFH
eukprot:7382564-Prymnesium_polylepis.1